MQRCVVAIAPAASLQLEVGSFDLELTRGSRLSFAARRWTFAAAQNLRTSTALDEEAQRGQGPPQRPRPLPDERAPLPPGGRARTSRRASWSSTAVTAGPPVVLLDPHVARQVESLSLEQQTLIRELRQFARDVDGGAERDAVLCGDAFRSRARAAHVGAAAAARAPRGRARADHARPPDAAAAEPPAPRAARASRRRRSRLRQWCDGRRTTRRCRRLARGGGEDSRAAHRVLGSVVCLVHIC